jgi:putative ABC transport system substrate-binding protein
VRRREFILFVGGATAALPLGVRAQNSEQLRRIGVLMGGINNPTARSLISAFEQTLKQLGWAEGSNVRIDIRWGGNNSERVAGYARELIQLKPDVILVGPTNALLPLKKETQTIPIVFVQVSDPLGRGVVTNLSRPTDNVTGFSNLEFSLIGKYLQLLKEVAPSTTRVAVMIHVSNAVSDDWYRAFNKVAPSFAIEPIVAPVQERTDIANTIESLTRKPNGGLIVPGDTYVDIPDVRKIIVELAATNRIPALYTNPEFVRDGGLMSYSTDIVDQYRGAAAYVARVLKGEKPSDLPVQQPTKFELTINLKAAKSLGLNVPFGLLNAANEVIE